MLTVYSTQGSPGASTTALHLAAHWASTEREVLLIEADPAGGSLSHNLGIQFTPGSASFLASGMPIVSSHLIDHSQDVLFENLHVMPAPGSPAGARGIFETLAASAEHLRAISTEMAVVIDGGRITADTAASKLTTFAGGVLVVCRNTTQLPSIEHFNGILATEDGAGEPRGFAASVGDSPMSPDEWLEHGMTYCGAVEAFVGMSSDLSMFLNRNKRKSRKWKTSVERLADKLYEHAHPADAPVPLPAAAPAAPTSAPASTPEQPAAAPAPQPSYEQPPAHPEPQPSYEQPAAATAPQPSYPDPQPAYEQPPAHPEPQTQPAYQQPPEYADAPPATAYAEHQPPAYPQTQPYYEQPPEYADAQPPAYEQSTGQSAPQPAYHPPAAPAEHQPPAYPQARPHYEQPAADHAYQQRRCRRCLRATRRPTPITNSPPATPTPRRRPTTTRSRHTSSRYPRHPPPNTLPPPRPPAGEATAGSPVQASQPEMTPSGSFRDWAAKLYGTGHAGGDATAVSRGV